VLNRAGVQRHHKTPADDFIRYRMKIRFPADKDQRDASTNFDQRAQNTAQYMRISSDLRALRGFP
jgi:hypothetical protein